MIESSRHLPFAVWCGGDANAKMQNAKFPSDNQLDSTRVAPEQDMMANANAIGKKLSSSQSIIRLKVGINT